MAAAVEFAQKGFDGASFNQIIESADISKGAAYYYFDDKSDLYVTVVEHAITRLAEFFGDFKMEKLTQENFWDVLREYSEQSLLRAQQYPKLTQLLRTVFNYAQTHPAAPAGAAVRTAARNWTATFLRRGQELGVIRGDLPEELLVELMMGIGTATDFWILEHVDTMSDEDIRHYSEQMTDIHRRVCTPYEGEK